jgi:hypothetical protein
MRMIVYCSNVVEANLWNKDSVDKQKRINEISSHYSVGMNIYHFKLAEKFDVESGDKKITYSSLEVDCREIFFEISSVLIRLFGGTIRIKEGAVSNKQYWLMIEGLKLGFMIKDVISKLYSFPIFFKSEIMLNIDQGHVHPGYYSLSTSDDD